MELQRLWLMVRNVSVSAFLISGVVPQTLRCPRVHGEATEIAAFASLAVQRERYDNNQAFCGLVSVLTHSFRWRLERLRLGAILIIRAHVARNPVQHLPTSSASG